MKKIVLIVLLFLTSFQFAAGNPASHFMLYNIIPYDDEGRLQMYCYKTYQNFKMDDVFFKADYDFTTNRLGINPKYLPGEEMVVIKENEYYFDTISKIYVMKPESSTEIFLLFELKNSNVYKTSCIYLCKMDFIKFYSQKLETVKFDDSAITDIKSIADLVCDYLYANKSENEKEKQGFYPDFFNLLIGENLNKEKNKVSKDLMNKFSFKLSKPKQKIFPIEIVYLTSNTDKIMPAIMVVLVNQKVYTISFSNFISCFILNNEIYLVKLLYYPDTGYYGLMLYKYENRMLKLLQHDFSYAN